MRFRLDSLKLARRLALGFFVVLALVAWIATVGVHALGNTQVDSARTVAAMQQAADADAWRGMTQLNICRTLALAKSGNQAALKAYFGPPMKQTTADISTVQKALEGSATSDEAKGRFADIAGKRKHYIAARDDIFARLDAADASAPGLVDTTLLPLADAYMAAVTDFGKYERGVSQAAIDDSNQHAADARFATIALAAIALAVGALSTWFITRSVTGPLTHAVEAVQAVARGDLSQSILVEGRDEVAALLRGLNTMQEALRRLVGDVRGSTDSIRVASDEVALGSQDLSARTERSAASLQETASSMERIAATVRHTADSACTANALAEGTARAASKGAEVVSRMTQTMDRITQHSTRIVDIVGIINGIAFQTNILALNAAVEAARAGEQGRGFAVVAGEVRSLAQRSAAAANDIKRLIQESGEAIAAGAALAHDAQASMADIDASVQRVSSVIGEIRTASSEQADGIGQVNLAVADIDQSTQQNAALVEQTAAAAESLKEQANRLADVAAVFRL